MQRQRALADAAFTRADGHEVTHAGEPISDAAALLGNLLENSGPSVPDDVVVALHFRGSFVSLHRRSRRGRVRTRDRGLHQKSSKELSMDSTAIVLAVVLLIGLWVPYYIWYIR